MREAIWVVNADKLFLMDSEAGRIERRQTPLMEGFRFASLETIQKAESQYKLSNFHRNMHILATVTRGSFI